MKITHKFTGAVLFEADVATMRECVEAAVRACACLSGADLRDADLRDADLRDCDLRNADLSETFGVISLGSPDNWAAWAYRRDGVLAIRVGCRDMRLDEARAYWCEGHPNWNSRREVAAALNYAEAAARRRGWKIEEAAA